MSVTWLNARGGEQLEEHWQDGGATTLGVRLSRDDLKDQGGIWWELIVLFNPHDGAVEFALPERGGGKRWSVIVDTCQPDAAPYDAATDAALLLPPRSLMLLA